MTGTGPGNAWRGYIVLSIAWLTVTGFVYFVARRPAAPPIQVLPALATAALPTVTAPPPTPALAPTPVLLRVDVAGAVQAPGVYRLPAGSIVADAIALAGGPAGDADLDRVNKAVPLQDGVQIYLPRLAQTALPALLAPQLPPASAPSAGAVQAGEPAAGALPAAPLDLNRATAEQLDTLPAIGPTLAARIIAGRPYSNVDDLLNVQGIGETTLAKLRPYLKVE